MGAAAQPKRLSIYSVQRPRKSRSKNGCLQCRGRRKKCSEDPPVCQSCEKSNLQCTWLPCPSEKSPIKTSSIAAAPKKSQQWTSAPPGQVRRKNQGGDPDDAPQTLEPDIVGWQSEDGDFDEAEFLSTTLTELRNLEQYLLQSCILSGDRSPSSGVGDDIILREGSEAGMLFDHFCQQTIPWLLNSDSHDDIIRNHIVPLATTNTLVLHALLALSGVHLRRAMPSIEAAALKYYTSSLCGLNQVLSDQSSSQAKDYRVLLTTIVLLCHYEIVDGGTFGAALQHVRACREFVYVALEYLHDPEHQELAVLLIENYGFFSLIANLSGSTHEDNIRLGLEYSTSIMPLIKDLPSFGSMFTYEPECLCLAPLIARMSRYRRSRAPLPMDQLYWGLHNTLQNSICWGSPFHPSDEIETRVPSKELLVKDLKTIALLIFLQASCHQNDEHSVDIEVLLQPLIDHAMVLMTHIQATDSHYGICWCYMVIGSHLQDKEAQGFMIRHLEMIQSRMPMQTKATELLRYLWEDADPAAFGVVGLEKVAMLHGTSSFVC